MVIKLREQAELKNVCACVRLTLSGAFSVVWLMKVYPLEQRCSCGWFPGDYHFWQDGTWRILRTIQERESDRSRRQPEGSFFVSFYRNLRYQPQLTAGGGGATPLPLRAQLVPSNTGTHFTDHEWMESWVNFRSIRPRSPLNDHPSRN